MKFKITISEILFYLSYTMWIIANVLEFTYYRDLPFARDIFKVLIIFISISFCSSNANSTFSYFSGYLDISVSSFMT